MLEKTLLAWVEVGESIIAGAEKRGVGEEVVCETLIDEAVPFTGAKSAESIIAGKDVRKEDSVVGAEIDGSEKRNTELVGILVDDAEITLCNVCSDLVLMVAAI